MRWSAGSAGLHTTHASSASRTSRAPLAPPARASRGGYAQEAQTLNLTRQLLLYEKTSKNHPADVLWNYELVNPE